VTPFASGREASWRQICDGQRAARRVELPLPATRPDVSASAALHCFGAPAPLSREASRSGEPIIDLALTAAAEAYSDAGLPGHSPNPNRLGCVIGTSKGGLRSACGFLHAERSGAMDSTSIERAAELWRRFLPDTPALAVAARFGAQGPTLCPVAACATGLASLQRGVDLIREGVCDVVLAGSTDASLTPLVVSSFQRLGVLAKGSEAATAGRPFDVRRNGFVIGEGAAVLVLESHAHAAARNATAYAEWIAGGLLADAAGLTHLDPSGAGLTRLIRDVLARARMSFDAVDYVNLHGTGTRENDVCETRGIRGAFEAEADRLSCSSLKGAIGHLLGAAGSVETACTLLALRDGIIPPTVNLEEADPECDLDYTCGTARPTALRNALKLSLGFGGHLTGALIGRRDDFAWRPPSCFPEECL
jgi:3-oxoacyl-[acyl-carrier-protein] synthase II